VDANSRSIRARILVSDPGSSLRPDAYVRVTIVANLGAQILIPKSAVVDTGERKVVFVVTGEDRFTPREIETGEESHDQIAVRSGLRDGERVVSSGTFLIDSESRLAGPGSNP